MDPSETFWNDSYHNPGSRCETQIAFKWNLCEKPFLTYSGEYFWLFAFLPNVLLWSFNFPPSGNRSIASFAGSIAPLLNNSDFENSLAHHPWREAPRDDGMSRAALAARTSLVYILKAILACVDIGSVRPRRTFSAANFSRTIHGKYTRFRPYHFRRG